MNSSEKAYPDQGTGQSGLPLFKDLCHVLELIQVSKGDAKKLCLGKYLIKWRKKYGNNFYPAIRLILPYLDKDRPAYGLKETNLAKLYIDVLGLGRKSEAGPGDLASVAFEIIAPRSTVPEGKITIQELNHQLDMLNSAGSVKENQKVIRYFVVNCTAEEQKWIIRIILRELKIGMNEKSVLQVFHPDAEDLFNVCSCLEKVCTELANPLTRLASKEITIFQPVKPMLSKPVPIQDIIKLMQGEFWMEQKIDGERMQLHINNGEFQYYSRKATEYTRMYGANKEQGTLTPFIYDCFDPRVRSVIIDGEMVAWDPVSEGILPFGTVKHAGLDQSNDPDKTRPFYIVFDIILCNGKPLHEKPLLERRRFLSQILNDKQGYLIKLPYVTGSTNKDLLKAIDAAIMERQEGLIIKNPLSSYTLNGRNIDWIKVKPEYLDSLGDSLDLLVIGGTYGLGKRRNMIGSFLCGLRDPKAERNGPRFLSFCRFGTGYTMEELRDFRKSIEDWKPFNPENCPRWLVLGHKKPDVIIEPEKSFVVQLKASEIVPGEDTYAVNYTLRFPRFEKVREDKDWKSAMTIQEMMDLRKNGFTSRSLTEADMITTSRIKRRKIMVPRKARSKVRILDNHVIDVSQTTSNNSTLFENMDFCVMQQKSKLQLQRLIKEHGGKFFQHPEATPKIHVLSDSDRSLSVQNLIKQEKCDIINSRWITESIKANRVLPLSHKFMIFTTEATTEKLLELMDEWGDSYMEEISAEDLKELLDGMSRKNPITDEKELRQIVDETQRLFTEHSFPNLPHNLFRHCVVYLDFPDVPNHRENESSEKEIENEERWWAIEQGCCDRLRYVQSILRYHGARVVNRLTNEKVTHIIMDQQDLRRVRKLKTAFVRRLPRFVLLTWVIESDEKEALLDENDYTISTTT
ncbi:hypothetical protein G9A89_014906 [Geosiphon pyriformis]|nr:hypothetical protein G9A89_014906 [Geosiphon pyriformis]